VDPDPIVYIPYGRNPATTATLLVRTRGESSALGPLLRAEVAALDSNLPLYRMRTLAEVVRDAQWNGRIAHMLIIVLTAIAVGLSAVGLYAVTAHSVSQRTHEIGIRMALGAGPQQVARMILRRALLQLACGFWAGVVCARLWDWSFSSGQGDVRASDPRSLLIVAASLAIVAVIACAVPARRAIRLDPVSAIRHE
jgi:putative ABC transport system permease protein